MGRLASDDERRFIVEALHHTTGFPLSELDTMIRLESNWDSGAINPSSKAEGLIQISRSTLARWGLRPGDLAAFEPAESLRFLQRFFREAKVAGRWATPGDTYLAVAAPSHIGASDDTVVYRVGTTAWRANPAWRLHRDGDITAGSVRRVLLRAMGSPGAPAPPPGALAPLPPPRQPARGSVPTWAWLVGLALVIGAAATPRRRRR